MISNSEEAKKELVRLGFPAVFLEIADGFIPEQMDAHQISYFYSFLPSLLKRFPEDNNYLPLWEVNGEAVIGFDAVRDGFFEFYFEDGNRDTKIADTYENFIADLLMKVSEIGCSNAEIEKLAEPFEYPRLCELQAFFENVRNHQTDSDLYDFLREVDEKQISEQIQAFQGAELNQNGESALKCEILLSLEDDLPNPVVLEFLLEVISDPEEYDLARIEALKIFQCWDVPTPELQTQVGKRLAGVIRDDSDDLVQEWAGIAAKNYVQVPEVFEASIEVLTNPDAGINARHNCLTAIEFLGPTPQTIAILESLIEDEEIGWAIPRILAGWAKLKNE